MKMTMVALSCVLSACASVSPNANLAELSDYHLCKMLNKTSGYNENVLKEYKTRDIARLRPWDDVAYAYNIEVGMRIDIATCIDDVHVYDIKTVKSQSGISHILDIYHQGKKMRVYAHNGIISNIFML